MKKRIIVPFCFIFAATVLIAFQHTETAGKNEIEAETHFFAMNTYISLTAYGSEAEAALSGAEGQIRELEDLWSVTEEQSEIYRLNHHQENSMIVSTETADLISYALGMAEQTDGALEPTIYPVLCEWGFLIVYFSRWGNTEFPDDVDVDSYASIVISGDNEYGINH